MAEDGFGLLYDRGRRRTGRWWRSWGRIVGAAEKRGQQNQPGYEHQLHSESNSMSILFCFAEVNRDGTLFEFAHRNC